MLRHRIEPYNSMNKTIILHSCYLTRKKFLMSDWLMDCARRKPIGPNWRWKFRSKKQQHCFQFSSQTTLLHGIFSSQLCLHDFYIGDHAFPCHPLEVFHDPFPDARGERLFRRSVSFLCYFFLTFTFIAKKAFTETYRN